MKPRTAFNRSGDGASAEMVGLTLADCFEPDFFSTCAGCLEGRACGVRYPLLCSAAGGPTVLSSCVRQVDQSMLAG